jgi:hypothetical protein
LIGSQNFYDSPRLWAQIASEKADGTDGTLWSPPESNKSKSLHIVHPVTMAAGPGEAMAHSAFDTILVLDFG